MGGTGQLVQKAGGIEGKKLREAYTYYLWKWCSLRRVKMSQRFPKLNILRSLMSIQGHQICFWLCIAP